MLALLALVVGSVGVGALNNGLALTPPMGWLSWQRYRCTVDCKEFPDTCLSEKLIKSTSDLMVSEGFLEAGYKYVSIDDCWQERKRGPGGEILPDRTRFPGGMRSLADYIHAKGLKFGLYHDIGLETCSGYPGAQGHERVDVRTFVGWKVDHIKLDGCNYDVAQMDKGYAEFGKLLNESGRAVLYSCSWPYFQREFSQINPDYQKIKTHCNLWRYWSDVQDSFSSVLGVMDWTGENQKLVAGAAGPGGWNDPDMLVIGNYGLSVDEARVQMAVWAVIAAPLFISADLSKLRPEFKKILLNKEVIAVNQDPLGLQGRRVTRNFLLGTEVWSRRLVGDAFAVAVVSRRTDGAPIALSYSLTFLELPLRNYTVKDLFDDIAKPFHVDELMPLRFHLNPSGVRFFKFFTQ